jgi:broad specificity phosphatase PhoE
LHNTYYAMRHGRSLANEEELIISHPDLAVGQYGLTEVGRREIASAIIEAMRDRTLDSTTLIAASDFARARESAEIARDLLGAQDIIVTPKLRERFFGTWDRQHHDNYRQVWDEDAVDGAQRHNEVESTQEVLTRTTSLVMELEASYSGRNILMISHGDTLQILQTAFERVTSANHRLLPHLQTGEIRQLELRTPRHARVMHVSGAEPGMIERTNPEMQQRAAEASERIRDD